MLVRMSANEVGGRSRELRRCDFQRHSCWSSIDCQTTASGRYRHACLTKQCSRIVSIHDSMTGLRIVRPRDRAPPAKSRGIGMFVEWTGIDFEAQTPHGDFDTRRVNFVQGMCVYPLSYSARPLAAESGRRFNGLGRRANCSKEGQSGSCPPDQLRYLCANVRNPEWYIRG
jgi:hypothetical protein